MRSRLLRIPVPDEAGARGRAWRVVAAAYAEREPAPRVTRRVWPLAFVAAAGVLVAAALSPPGRAVIDSIRRAVGVEKSQPALFSLPTRGRLLVVSAAGPWIVQRDGSRRLLGAYHDAAWSPHGLFVAAAGRNELLALEPDGTVRWSLPRRDVRFPRWTGSRTDTRIAYLSAGRLRLVAGDGTGDAGLCGRRAAAPVAPAWRPGANRVLAYAGPGNRVVILDLATCTAIGAFTHPAVPKELSWSDDGRALLVRSPHALRIVGADGRLLRQEDPSDGTRVVAAAFVPGSHEFAEIRAEGSVSSVYVTRRGPQRLLFRGSGRFQDVAWSPDGRWLIVTWPTADQWVLIRASQRRRIAAVSNIAAQFGGAFPRVEGWCCG